MLEASLLGTSLVLALGFALGVLLPTPMATTESEDNDSDSVMGTVSPPKKMPRAYYLARAE